MDFHKHINEDGEVLILRRIPKSRVTDGDGRGKPFKWPSGVGSVVECPDWNPNPCCGGGFHGWPWGFGLGEGCDYDIIDDIWLIIGCKPDDVVGELDGCAKCKFRRGVIRLEGAFGDAMAKVVPGFTACVEHMAQDRSQAATAGYGSKAATAGDWSQADAAGDNTLAAVRGHGGRVRAGKRGAIALAEYSEADG